MRMKIQRNCIFQVTDRYAGMPKVAIFGLKKWHFSRPNKISEVTLIVHTFSKHSIENLVDTNFRLIFWQILKIDGIFGRFHVLKVLETSKRRPIFGYWYIMMIYCVCHFFFKVIPLVKSAGTRIEKCCYLVTNPDLCCTSTIVVFETL